ncbi:response regulator [Proteus mirabilis]
MDRLLTRESIHLIVLDLMLPGEDGLSICRRLRSQNNPIPIIMVTAKGEEVEELSDLKLVLMIISQNHLTQESY